MVTNFHSERPNRENGTTFSEFPFVPGIFQWDEPKKRLPFTSQPEFLGICDKRWTTNMSAQPPVQGMVAIPLKKSS